MRRTIYLFLLFLFLLPAALVRGQSAGNEIYRDNDRYGYGHEDRKVVPCNSYVGQSNGSFTVSANLMMNVIADQFVLTLGLSQEGLNTKECQDKMQKRIGGFTAALLKMGIVSNDIYVDMISQNRIYDYKISGKVAEEYAQGIELKKNVIVRFNNSRLLDQILVEASEFGIYDIVKVDYIVSDMDAVYARLYREAMALVMQKRDRYVSQNRVQLAEGWRVVNDNYRTFYPNDLYRNYNAYETGDVNYGYNTSLVTKEKRKSSTHYYDKLHYSQFDKVINPVVTEPAVEFTYTITVAFDLNRPDAPLQVNKKSKRN